MKNVSLRKCLFKFLNSTTIHGLSNIARSNSYIASILWLFIFIISSAGLCYFQTYGIMNYLNFDVITNIKIIQERRMLLPTITFCNMNSYKDNMNYSIEDMLVYCKYENIYCTNPYRFTEVQLSSYKCYSFNNASQLFKTSRQGKFYISNCSMILN